MDDEKEMKADEAVVSKNQPTTNNQSEDAKSDSKGLGLIGIIVLIVVLLAIGILGYIYFFGGNDDTNGSKPTPTKMATVAPTPKDVSASPTATSDAPTPTPDPYINWRTYRNEDYRYSLKYPDSMELREKQGFDVFLVQSGPAQGQGGIEDSLVVSVYVVNNSEQKSLRQLAYESLSVLFNLEGPNDPFIKDDQLDGEEAVHYTGTGIEPFNTYLVKLSDTIALGINGSYASPDDIRYQEYSDTFLGILDSVNLK